LSFQNLNFICHPAFTLLYKGKLPFFAQWPMHKLISLANMCEQKMYRYGTVIQREGETPNCVSFILSGGVKVCKSRKLHRQGEGKEDFEKSFHGHDHGQPTNGVISSNNTSGTTGTDNGGLFGQSPFLESKGQKYRSLANVANFSQHTSGGLRRTRPLTTEHAALPRGSGGHNNYSKATHHRFDRPSLQIR
jgi:hypothetical protein